MIFALLLQLSSTAFAQSLPEIVVEAGSKSVPVAVPLPVGADADQAKRMRAVIERDLDLSGYFELVSPDAFLETSSAGVSPGEFDFADWRVIKAAVLAKTRITSTPDGLQVDLYVYDVNAGNKLIGKRFTGTADQTRYLGHKVADAILLAVTGKPGFFGSQVLAVGTARELTGRSVSSQTQQTVAAFNQRIADDLNQFFASLARISAAANLHRDRAMDELADFTEDLELQRDALYELTLELQRLDPPRHLPENATPETAEERQAVEERDT